MKLRIVEFSCPENTGGRCYKVERKSWLFGWVTHLTTFSYGGTEMAEHFPSLSGAYDAAMKARKRGAWSRVVSEFTVP